MGDFKITQNELLGYVAFINFVLGLLFGSFPLIVGLKLKNRSYALYGFIGSVIGGSILGILLSFPIAIIFTWLMLRTQNNVDFSIQNSSDSNIS